MRVKRRNFVQRVGRIRLRASSQRPPARLEAPAQCFVAGHVAAPLAVATETGGNRRFQRHPLDREISVRKAGSFSFQLPAIDVSAGGCRLELVEMADVSEHVVVRLPAIEPLGAGVVWVKGNHAGICFKRPLHPAVFDQLVDRCAPCAA